MLDIYRAIRELEQEKKRLDGVISSLEAFIEAESGEAASEQKQPQQRRGRKDMTPEERLAVSERMRKYWEARRTRPNA